MNSAEARRVIESLGKGIPPSGFVRYFTVGRKSEIQVLSEQLQKSKNGTLLIQANWGSGKSHLLQFIREEALAQNYIVSTVELDAKAAVRFNRMDQIFGAICRGIEIPSSLNGKGIRTFFDFITRQIESDKAIKKNGFWPLLTNNWRWDFSEELNSPAMFVALRAWVVGKSNTQDVIEDWLNNPWVFKAQRKKLYYDLVYDLRQYFRDPREDRQFYSDGVFIFDTQGYIQSWGALKDIHVLARAAGLKGLIILFDEFEKSIIDLRNISHQQAAFWNLFQFYSSKRFPGMTYYAVTPEFSEKCKNLLTEKNCWDYDFSSFDRLPTFKMSPLTEQELEELALRIMDVHGQAYDWEPDLVMKASQLSAIVRAAASVQIQDRARHVIISVVKALNDLLQESE
ncbi:hypothetical protein CY91_04685 [Dehalococcoides mccartyi]|uniref:BREX system ATP-binding domain-containing protein n=1 Tax=Dehalococcoides mccartyi TaxID=61435 RepID=UPI00071E2032|nr:BREX system ATP-binding domain-containing protein [Dehalococcoides mccartyi]KSV16599.1 hypothetical protein CY91_04685 [Dehalococcoides mccartyi]